MKKHIAVGISKAKQRELYVAALERENERLCDEWAKLRVENVRLNILTSDLADLVIQERAKTRTKGARG